MLILNTSQRKKKKKEHIHLILSLDNPRTIESLSKRINVPQNLIQNIKSLRGSCRYLVHRDNEEKYQYEINDVICSKPFNNTFIKSFDDLMSDEEILDNIYEFIRELKDSRSAIELEIDLTKFVCSNAYDRVFKRYYNSIVKYINFLCTT